MAYVADLHIHSRFSRACSPQLNIPNLLEWAKYKGIDMMGTGDCLHPLWQAELKKDLVTVRLKIPVCCSKDDRLVISRMLGNRWRLIGVAKIVGN